MTSGGIQHAAGKLINIKSIGTGDKSESGQAVLFQCCARRGAVPAGDVFASPAVLTENGAANLR
jgi:hypothetical protein